MQKKTAFAIIASMQTFLHSQEFKEAGRFPKQHLSRQRLLRFTVLIGLFLHRLTKTLHIECERFFRVLQGDDTDLSVRKHACSKARKT